MSKPEKSLTRFMAVFAGGTLISRLLGLVRDIVIADAVPFVSREVFLFAFRFPNMLRDMLGEGAVNAAYVPLFSRTRETEGDDAFRRVARACFGATLLLFALLTLAGVLLVPFIPAALRLLQPFTGTAMPGDDHLDLALAVTPWLMPYFFLIGAGVFAMGPLFVMQRYSTASWSPALLNVALIAACLLASDYFPDPVWALVAGVWLGGIAQAAVLLVAMKRHAGFGLPSLELRHPGVRKAMLLLVPIVLGQATGEVNKVVDAFFAFKLEAVSYLYYANRLVQLPLSVFGLAVAVAILPSISAAGAREDYGEIRATLAHGFRQSAFLVMPALAGLLILREPIMQLLFAHEGGAFSPEEARHAANALFYLAWGLLFFSWVKVGVQGFYAVHNTATPVIVASLSMGLNIALNLALVGPMGYQGLALATTISYAANAAGLYLLLSRRYGNLLTADFVRGLLKIALASAAMGGAVFLAHQAIAAKWPETAPGAELARVLAPVLAGLLTYPAACRLLRAEDLALVGRLARRVRKR